VSKAGYGAPLVLDVRSRITFGYLCTETGGVVTFNIVVEWLMLNILQVSKVDPGFTPRRSRAGLASLYT